MDNRRVFGNEGEEIVAKYFRNLGYKIFAKQWRRLPFGEIDIVAEDKNELVFAEVKSRRSNFYGFPEEAVTKNKRRKIGKLIDMYLQENRIVNKPYRFDVVSVEFADVSPKITHFRSLEI